MIVWWKNRNWTAQLLADPCAENNIAVLVLKTGNRKVMIPGYSSKKGNGRARCSATLLVFQKYPYYQLQIHFLALRPCSTRQVQTFKSIRCYSLYIPNPTLSHLIFIQFIQFPFPSLTYVHTNSAVTDKCTDNRKHYIYFFLFRTLHRSSSENSKLALEAWLITPHNYSSLNWPTSLCWQTVWKSPFP